MRTTSFCLVTTWVIVIFLPAFHCFMFFDQVISRAVSIEVSFFFRMMCFQLLRGVFEPLWSGWDESWDYRIIETWSGEIPSAYDVSASCSRIIVMSKSWPELASRLAQRFEYSTWNGRWGRKCENAGRWLQGCRDNNSYATLVISIACCIAIFNHIAAIRGCVRLSVCPWCSHVTIPTPFVAVIDYESCLVMRFHLFLPECWSLVLKLRCQRRENVLRQLSFLGSSKRRFSIDLLNQPLTVIKHLRVERKSERYLSVSWEFGASRLCMRRHPIQETAPNGLRQK